MTIRISFLAGFGALASLATPLALGQEQTINDYVRGLVDFMADTNETLVGDIELDEVEIGDAVEYVFRLDPEKAYFVYAACDDDCLDIDMVGTDGDGDLVDDDVEEDATPLLYILPGESGDELHVSVEMADCETEVCVVGLGLYETPLETDN